MNQPTEPKADKSGVRRHNLSLVLRTVHDAGESTRAAVAARVGLTRPAVSSLVEQLLALGLLVESGKTFSGQAGRPGTVLKPADTGPAGLGVEISVDYVTACVVDLTGTDRVRRTERLDHHATGVPEVLARAARVAAEALDAAAERRLVPAGAGLALPGLVSGGTVRQAPNLGWHGVEAERLFGEALTALRPAVRGLPLTSDNEAHMAALAELWSGPPGGPRTFLHLTGETGVGGAIVVHGELLRGAHGFAGEIGHLTVDAAGPRCRCGAHGCLEQYAGQTALLAAAGASGVQDLTDRARAGEARALAALAEAGRMLGRALAGAVNLLDPEAVVLGGIYPRLMTWLVPALSAELSTRAVSGLWTPEAGRVRPASTAADASRGAAGLVLHDVLADPLAYATNPVA
ncbi:MULTISPECIES: ROK family transcriptional regulator [unclassified Streptomyces]|uniref:ROK family transcriptional regulator n=1 Tax=unclassified Streptomyces TaxID=2593676 RepID=UPI00166030AA|nr:MULTISPECIES: ROK family transcriptional regulator [unclassified Streptomyces]MBD0708232.1 transcriptional regulator [Streptomyces sp. CBMA291]MBD0717801.1 transcriptional regulator [Streptomyces sp. CBMA370]